MICQTCNANVHPQPHRILVGSCQKCSAEIQGFKAHDDRYQCGACGNVDRAVIGAKWIHKCPAANCGARMPTPEEVVDETVAAPLPGEPNVNASGASTKPRPVRALPRPMLRNEPADPIAQCRERLEFVRARIDELRAYEKEERRLSRMLSVIDADDMAAE